MSGAAPATWRDRLEAALRDGGARGLRRVRVLAETASTQDAARRDDAPPGDVYVALRQTRGRGRLGSAWADTGDEGIAVSIVLPPGPPERLALALAVGVARGIEPALGRRAAIKWPNDVLVEGRKLAGVLVEQDARRAIAGIGVNVAQTAWPAALAGRAASLRQLGSAATRLEVLEALLPALDAALRAGEAELVAAFAERDALVGRRARFRHGGKEIAGTVARVDPLRGLEIRTADGSRWLPAAKTRVVPPAETGQAAGAARPMGASMPTPRTPIALLAAGLLAAAAASAPPPAPFDPLEPVGLEAVDQAVADRNALSASLRDVPEGLHEPRDFEQVYGVPGRDDLFLRARGGLYAVFPQSVYRRGRRGVVPVVPENTTFYIGRQSLESLRPQAPGPPPEAALAARRPDLAERVRTRLVEAPVSAIVPAASVRDTGDGASVGRGPRFGVYARPEHSIVVLDEPDAERPAVPAGTEVRQLARPRPVTVANDPAYRVRRIGELLRAAVRAEHASRDGSAQPAR